MGFLMKIEGLGSSVVGRPSSGGRTGFGGLKEVGER